ncbi:hypothetical protein BDZ85DRAFT_116847 [Elsinoe ampelina]|uniref:BZIP domain-containing protein n=1 Tax=Elsinoe ampelina TaxID=302913 RepID=A0A6A6FY87_9PEZI|nr:hypothetical protein BDZ85DRAFT_116847 [Elsinoe ampelina]
MSQYPGPDMSQPDDDSNKRYGSSESESKPSGSSSQPRKRASRAGTRSVSNLSAAQLERKRANDREAQRAIRLRTKEHIESLERKVAEYTGISEQRDRVLAANQARVRELEQENAYLRSRVGNDAFLMQLPSNSESRPTDSALGHSAQTSPQTKFTSEQISRPASQAARHSVSGPSSGQPSRPEAWRQQSQPGVFSPTESNVSNQSRPEPSRSVSWRNPSEVSTGSSGHSLSAQNSMDQSQRSYSTPSAHERPGWSGNQGYNYIMDPNQQSGNYTASSKPAGFQGHMQSGHYPIVPPTQSQQQNYGAPLGTPSAEFSNLSMQSPANPAPSHEQSQEHAPYGVQAGHIQQGQNYQPPNQQASMPRPALAPPFNQPSTSTGYPQPGMTQTQHMPMEYQGPAGQPSYSYGQYHGNG